MNGIKNNRDTFFFFRLLLFILLLFLILATTATLLLGSGIEAGRGDFHFGHHRSHAFGLQEEERRSNFSVPR